MFLENYSNLRTDGIKYDVPDPTEHKTPTKLILLCLVACVYLCVLVKFEILYVNIHREDRERPVG